MSEALQTHSHDDFAEQGDEQSLVMSAEQDRDWMQHLGYRWPAEAVETEELETISQFIMIGDKSLRNMTGEQYLAERENVLTARYTFYRLFRNLRPDLFEAARRYSTSESSRHISLRPSVFIGAQRYYHELGVDGLALINRMPQVAILDKAKVERTVEALCSRGIDAVEAISNDSGGGSFMTFAVESLFGRLQPMYAAARAAGWTDYHDRVNRIVEKYPSSTGYKPDKTRTLARILAYMDLKHGPEDIAVRDVRDLYIRPLECSVVAWLERGDVIRSMSGLKYHVSRNYNSRTRSELLGIIAAQVKSDADAKAKNPKHKSDPVVKAYVKGYPFDPNAAQEVHARHIRSRNRRRLDENYGPGWQGPSMLVNLDPDSEELLPNLSSTEAYLRIVESPELDVEDTAELFKAIQQYPYPIRGYHSGDTLSEDQESARRARTALAARHLAMVPEIIGSCVKSGDTEEMIAIGNAALSQFAAEYVPDEGATAEDYRERLAVAIMRTSILDRKGPRYSGLTFKELEHKYPLDADRLSPQQLAPPIEEVEQVDSLTPEPIEHHPEYVYKDGALDAAEIAEIAGLTVRQVRVIMGKLQSAGKFKNLPAPIVRKATGRGMTKHYKGAALDVILQAIDAEIAKSPSVS